MSEHRFRLFALGTTCFVLTIFPGLALGHRAVSNVGVDFSKLDEKSYRELDILALERKVAIRLMQDGFATVLPSQRPLILLMLRKMSAEILVEAHGPRGTEKAEVRILGRITPASLPELHLEITQKIAELARGVANANELTPGAQHSKPASPASAVRDRLDERSRKLRRGQLRFGFGALWQAKTPDPTIAIGAQYNLSGRFDLRFSGAVSPSQGSEIDLFSWQLLGGLGYCIPLFDPIDLTVGVLAGIAAQHYQLRSPQLADSHGDLAHGLVLVPVSVTWWPWQSLGLGARVAPGVSQEGWGHTRGREILWERSAFRLEVGVEAAVSF